MQKVIVLLIVLSGSLSACVAYDFPHNPGYGEYQTDHAGYRRVLGDFCPPGQAMKGYC
jgi:hypothetical protein